MTYSRHQDDDFKAIAAMPGLETLAEVLDPYCTDSMEAVIYLAAQHAVKSRNQLSAAFRQGDRWSVVVDAAAKVGRTLGDPPSHDKLRHLRDRCPTLGRAMADAFPAAMTPLVQDLGLLRADTEVDLTHPARANTIYGDGTVLAPQSGVTIDEGTGEIVGSRSTGIRGPKTAERGYGKEGPNGPLGVPVTLLGVRGPDKLRRAVLAVDLHMDGNEIGCAMSLFRKVHALYGAGIQAFSYDMLMNGRAMQEVMRHGVVPLVDMPGAAKTDSSISVPKELQFTLGTKSRRKTRAHCKPVESVRHTTKDGDCQHELWAIDGGLVSFVHDPADPMRAATLDDPVVPMTNLHLEETATGEQRLIGTYLVRCTHGSFRYTRDLSCSRPGRSRDGGQPAWADFLRPIPNSDGLDRLRGYRSDVESTFRQCKYQLPLPGRANSLAVDHVLLDLVGLAVCLNARAWDTHVGHVSPSAEAFACSAIRKRQRELEEAQRAVRWRELTGYQLQR